MDREVAGVGSVGGVVVGGVADEVVKTGPSMAQAVADMVRPYTSMLDHSAARARLREVVMTYVHTLRADGASPSEIMTSTNGLARRAVAGVIPTNAAAKIRDSVRRWTLVAYDQPE